MLKPVCLCWSHVVPVSELLLWAEHCTGCNEGINNCRTWSLFSKPLGDKMMCEKHLLHNMAGFYIVQNECKVLGAVENEWFCWVHVENDTISSNSWLLLLISLTGKNHLAFKFDSKIQVLDVQYVKYFSITITFFTPLLLSKSSWNPCV